MAYTYSFKQKFAAEFANFPIDQQDKIFDFLDTYEKYGLVDFSNYVGKITPSWKGALPGGADYNYALTNYLWHYHIGLPYYAATAHGQYKTSDWVLHFQWPKQGDHIFLVDLYSHYTRTGQFYLPSADYLTDLP
jgi:hypothetical protein